MRNWSLMIISALLLFLFSCGTAQQADDGAAKPVDAIVEKQRDTLQTAPAHSPQIAELIKTKLAEQFKDDLSKNFIDSFSRRFIFYPFDLDGDDVEEIFVGFTGTYFCGSGGCSFQILKNNGELVSKFTVADFPIAIDTATSKGWRNLVVKSGNKYHVLKYDGTKYPSNPSIAPLFTQPVAENLPKAFANFNEPSAWIRF